MSLSKQFTKRERSLLLILTMVVLVAVYYLCIVQPVERTLAELQTQSEDLETSLILEQSKAQKLEEMTGGKSADFLPSAQPIPVKHDYPTTANGESYGSYLDRDKYGYPPQLIAVIGDNDQSGYVRLSDFRAANRPANVVWDVYDLKGSVIDTFSR